MVVLVVGSESFASSTPIARSHRVLISHARPPLVLRLVAYTASMPNENNNLPPELERYLALCQRIYERMEREGSWPWEDSSKPENLVESKDNQTDV